MEAVLIGISGLFNWQVLAGIVLGTIIGIVVGAIPGLGPTIAISLVLPFTFYIPAEIGVPFLVSIYGGSSYGGSISAILLNIPGTSAAAATTFDGYPLARQGKARRALRGALYASVFGNTFSILCLIFLASSLAGIALKFGPAQLFAVLVFSYLIVSVTGTGESKIKGIISGTIGFIFGCMGKDPIVGTPRFNVLGIGRYDSFNQTALLIGAFAFSEALVIIHNMAKEAKQKKNENYTAITVRKEDKSTLPLKEFFSHWKLLFTSSAMGAFMGAVPGLGSTIASMVGYSLAKSGSKNPEKFGTGCIEGILGPESANNATCGSNLLPYLALGIPGSPIVALIGSALIMNGIAPGPTIFQTDGATLYKIFAALLFMNVVILAFGLSGFNNLAAKIALVPMRLLVAGIVVLCVAGTFSTNNRVYDVYVLMAFGVIAYMMRRAKFSTAPMVISYVLARDTEKAFRQSLLISNNNMRIFVGDSLSVCIWIACIAFLVWSIWSSSKAVNKSKADVK